MKKILITSPDAIIDKATSEFYPDIIDALKYFQSIDKEFHVVIISANKESLKSVPAEFKAFEVGKKERAGRAFVDLLKTHLQFEIKDLIVLGSKDLDMQIAANSKLLLLRAEYAKYNNPTERIYTNPYGISINSGKGLKLLFEQFLLINKPWFYELDINDITTIYSLTNANTYNASNDEKILNNHFSACLKDGDDSYRHLFLIYILVCSYFIDELATVNYFATYPSSSTTENEDMLYFKESIRKSFNNRGTHQLFIRHKTASKRHNMTKNKRITDGCNSQYDSIHLNKYYKGRLKGCTVCIIDDFTTYGTSCETVRHLLEAEKVARIIFITFGKFGKEYHAYKYYFNGDTYSTDYKYNRDEAITMLNGSFNANANRNFVEALRGLI